MTRTSSGKKQSSLLLNDPLQWMDASDVLLTSPDPVAETLDVAATIDLSPSSLVIEPEPSTMGVSPAAIEALADAIRAAGLALAQGEDPAALSFDGQAPELSPIAEAVAALLRQQGAQSEALARHVDALSAMDTNGPNVRRPALPKGLSNAIDRHERALTQLVKGKADGIEDIERLVREIDRMTDAHAMGDIDTLLDTDALPASVREAADKVNAMVKGHISTKHMVIDQLTAFSEGYFELPFPKLPRKKAFVSEAVEMLRTRFRSLIAEIKRVADAIQDGDLAVSANVDAFQGDFRRIVTDFGRVTDQLNGVFSSLGSEVSQATVAVTQLSRAAQDLASSSQIQSASVDEVSSSAEETDTQVKANAAAAGQANQLVKGAASVAAEGKEKIARMVQAMEGIRASSQDIAKIIKVIDEIAFQTNLLALNAAVEAARAGQHGRGFAVVAQEVRNLAGRSAKAARETSELIDSAGARVQAGVKIADETSRAFTSIADDIEQVQTFMREIAVASDEQARGVAQINAAMGEVAKTALLTSQQADEVAAGASEIEAATQRMREEMSRFRLREASASPSATAMPDLSALSPEMLSQIMAMLGANRPAPHANTHPTSRNTDRDERGFKGF